MRRAFVVAVIGLLASGVAMAGVVNSLHDLSGSGPSTVTDATEVCVFCHTPHQVAAAVSGAADDPIDPLWNHTLSTNATYGVYDSDTMDATPTELGNSDWSTGNAAIVSNLCLSCHDGTVSVSSMYNPPVGGVPTTSGGGGVLASGLMDPADSANVGIDLTNDHPVNFTYPGVVAGEFQNPTNAVLFGGEVQCGSCHDAHNDTVGEQPFLVTSNTDSALCTDCHLK